MTTVPPIPRSPALPVIPPAISAAAAGAVCGVCASGCSCASGPGCGHYGCHGYGPRTCPGADAAQAAYEVQLTAVRAQRAALHARRARHSAVWAPPRPPL